MAYDVIIKSGTVIDGTGANPVLTDVGIEGDRISAVGDLGSANAKKIINATGKFVTPGFIDVTNHSDTYLTLFKYPLQESMLMQGVTSVLGGNCGASLAPLASDTAINAVKKWSDPSEININWASVEEFLRVMEEMRIGVNFGTFVGYGTLRRGIIGDQARILNFDEREQVKQLLSRGMQEGAFGLSLGLIYGHERISTTEEIIEIAKIVAENGGAVKIHLRSEGLGLLASVNEAVRIARETGVSLQISHLKAIGKKAWYSLPKALGLLSRARESGLNINFDVSPYRTTGSQLYLLIPGWARQGGFSELFRRIDSPKEKAQIVEALRNHTLHYDRIFINSAKIKNAVGHTLAELAKETGLSPEEALVETIRANEGRVAIIGKTVSLANTMLEAAEDFSFIASDGAGYSQEMASTGDLVHPRSFGTFPRFLHKFVAELNIPLGKAVWKITGGPAEKFGIEKRGTLKPGNYADAVVFDPRIIKDRATYQNPFRFPAGIEWVLLNGKTAVEDGKQMAARHGRILKKKHQV